MAKVENWKTGFKIKCILGRSNVNEPVGGVERLVKKPQQ